jgi:hypothetical protein
MGFFYEKTENEKEIVVSHQKCAWHYISLWGAVLFLWGWYFFGGRLGNLFMKLSIVCIMVVTSVINWKVIMEVKKASKKGKVKVSGSRYSLSNPVKYIITKNGEGEE